MISKHSDYRYSVQKIDSLSDVPDFISGENTTGGPTFFLSDEDQEANFYSSAFLHKNHPLAFIKFPTFNSRIADPLFSLDHSMKKKVTFRLAKHWPWRKMKVGFGVTEGTLKDGSKSFLVSARNPIAHLAFIHALTSGEIKSVYFKKDYVGTSIYFADSGGVIRLQNKKMSVDKKTMHISFLTTLDDHMFIFDDDERTSKEMTVIGVEISESSKKIKISSKTTVKDMSSNCVLFDEHWGKKVA
jgi:hypothetical protein